jgi:RNA polymerase sigma factor (sigma-70 family)
MWMNQYTTFMWCLILVNVQCKFAVMKHSKLDLSDSEIVRMLRSGVERQEHQATDAIYAHHHDTIVRQLVRNGCSMEDASDAFQHALEWLWINLAQPKFAIEASIGAWLHTVARRHWLNHLARKERLDKVADAWKLDYIQAHDDEDAVQIEAILRQILSKLDAQCRRLLELRFLEGLDRQGLASELGYGNVESVSNRTNVCRDRAKQIGIELGLGFS